MKYSGSLTREGHYWVVTIDDVGVTQARNLTEAQSMAEDLVKIVTGKRDPDVGLVLAPDLRAEVLGVEKSAKELERQQKAYSATLRKSVAKLANVGLTGADIAKALKLSPQRVSQILSEPR